MSLNPTNTKRKITFSVRTLVMLCFIFAIMKLTLISGEEIIARNQPYDDLWQILAAARGYWFGGYSNTTLVHLPVYPLWIAATYFTGVPLRISIELLFLISAALFVLSLAKSGIHLGVCLAAYCLIIFHPVSFQLFNYTLTDTLYAPLLLLSLSGIIIMWVTHEDTRFIKYAIATGIAFSLLWNLRKENILIVGLFLLMTLLSIFVLRQEGRNLKYFWKQFSVFILIPAAIIVVFSFSIKVMNFMKFGLFVSTEMNAPGYLSAYKALLRIKPVKSIRFVPVPKNVREAAYSVSPAFKELQPYFEGDFGYAAASETRKHMGIEGEIAAGWFYWSLRDAVSLAGHYSSAQEAETYYKRVSNEINTAIDDERLPSRTVLFSFLDPESSNYLPYLGESFLKMWRLFTSVTEPAREKEDPNLSEEVRKAFDIVGNRRAALTSGRGVTLRGWAFHDGEGISQILLRTAEGKILASTDQFSSRPDVATSYKAKGIGNVPENTGFTLTATQGQQLSDAYLVIVSNRNNEYTIPYKQIDVGKPLWLASSGSDKKITYAIDFVSRPKGSGQLRKAIQSFLWAIYGKLVAYLTYICILGVFILLFCYKKISIRNDIYVILLLLLFVVLSRVTLFSLIDASSWPGNQPRYLFPVMPVYSCFLLLFIYYAISVVKKKKEQ